MSKKRVLLMYISENSGHHRACLAIEKSMKYLSGDVETLCVNSFCYTNPILEKIINKAYMGVIQTRPEVWGYLYDNPRVVEKTHRLRATIHKYNSQKMKNLLDDFKPDAVVCTQAFPCGILADYKKSAKIELLLSGVLTDYSPHSFWAYDNVDMYFVPSEETKEKLISNGIAADRIRLTGIPIDPVFKKVVDKKKVRHSLGLLPEKPIILVMGGSQGIGPIKEIMKVLNNVKADFQVVVVAGSNKRLYRYLKNRSARFNKKTIVLSYSDNINELMEISSIVISKPGGITMSEALAKGLIIFIVKPIPGHEQLNTDHLTKHRVAIKIDNLPDIGIFLKELLIKPQALTNMRQRAKIFSRPDSASDIARAVLERII